MNFSENILMKQWQNLTDVQKKSLLNTIKSFFNQDLDDNHNNELHESDGEYNLKPEIFNLLNNRQKKALSNFLASAGITKNEHIGIEEYNREIDEAMQRMDAGEFYSHEEVTAMSEKWLSEK
jgi:hypothetical protein